MNYDKFKFEELDKSDLDKVLAIENDSFKQPWNLKLFEDELNSCNSKAIKLSEQNGKIVGYIFIKLILDELHILNIAVNKKYREQGLATMLLKKIEQIFGCGKLMLLEVRVSNSAALSLYKKLGFKELYRRKNYYPDGEDAIVMEKKACVTVE